MLDEDVVEVDVDVDVVVVVDVVEVEVVLEEVELLVLEEDGRRCGADATGSGGA